MIRGWKFFFIVTAAIIIELINFVYNLLWWQRILAWVAVWLIVGFIPDPTEQWISDDIVC